MDGGHMRICLQCSRLNASLPAKLRHEYQSLLSVVVTVVPVSMICETFC